MSRFGPGVGSLALIPPSGRDRAPSRAIRGRSASRGFAAGYRAIATLAPRRVCREPAARRRPALGLRPRLPTPTREAVALPCPPPLRAPALRRKRLARLPAAGRRRAEGGAREDAADRRPPRRFRLQRRFPQRGRARHALLTYVRRTLRLRGATYPPREACPRSGCPRYNGNNSFSSRTRLAERDCSLTTERLG